MRRHAQAVTAGSPKEGHVDNSTRLLSGARASLLACLFVALLGALVPATVSAAITHKPEAFSPLTGSGSGVTIHTPSGVAIDEATGNVFLTDGTGGNAVLILGGTGAAPAGLVSPFSITGLTFGAPAGIAYDNAVSSPAKGTLYVFQEGTIKKYLRNAGTERYEAAGEITAAGTAAPAGMTVDGAGNVYLGDFSSQKVREWSPTGTLLHEYSFVGTPTNRPSGMAVDNAGDLFVQRQGGGGLYKYPVNGLGEVEVSKPTPVTTTGAFGVAYDPASNHVFVTLAGRVVEYDATTLAKIDEFGEGVLGSAPERVAVNSATGRIYVADNSSGKKNVAAFSAALTVPTTTAAAATNITGTKATLNGSVNPEGIAVTECFFEYGETTAYGKTAPCEGPLPPADSEAHPVSADISGLSPNAVTYHFRLVAENENGTEKSADKTLVTAKTVATEAATGIGATTATLNGALRPEGLQYTACFFEYSLTTSTGFEGTAPCSPPSASIEPDFAVHPVSGALTGLQSNATYKFRLTATNSKGTLSGEVLTFTTLGPPQISELRASFADQSSATLEAKINPSGFGTSYRFEWGPTASYGNSVPAEFEPFVGSGEVPVQISAKVSGLSPGTTYHYRVVATNSVDAAESPDQILETLNSCGLPEGRCFELVSPRDAGPVAAGGVAEGGFEPHFQAADAPGSLAYIMETGLLDSTRGLEVLYHGTRGPEGWSSTQLSPPILVRSETNVVTSSSASTEGLSGDLSCGIVESNQPLTSDAGPRLLAEAGGFNLYRRNPDGSYTAISKLSPENPDAASGILSEYLVDGFSDDCGKAVFGVRYRYPGVPAVGVEPLYEWDEGTLRSVGFVPGSSGEVAVEATAGTGQNHSNVVSEDGSRVFFSATRKTSPNPAEIGKTGVFVRENGVTTRDLSLSETSTPDEGATYEYATKDGSRVFFTANAGLTEESSPEGIDLYEYDLEDEELSDLSVDHEAGGAEVGGFIGASEDGSRVYFAAQGKLAPGRGKTFAQNQSDNTYSVYAEQNGEIGYAGVVANGIGPTADLRSISVEFQSETSRVSPDGRYLLFESTADVTGYEPGGEVTEAYLYDADSEATVCVSCRQDGKPTATLNGNDPLLAVGGKTLQSPPRTLVERNGQAHVFFISFDRLATGTREGEATVYEWAHGQVFKIATEPRGLRGPVQEATPGIPSNEQYVYFGDASADGSDLYFATPQTLSWEDGDGRFSVYDARIGGGFPEPPAPQAPCEPTSEGSCQGAASPAGAAAPTPSSSTFSGPGNVKPKAQHKKRKKRHHRKRKARHTKHKRHANGNNRRAGK